MDTPLSLRASPPPEPRTLILDRAAMDTAHAWADECVAELAREGRPVDGGWPGTLSEARTRVAAEATRALAVEAMPSPTYDELDRAAQSTYAEARRSWQRSSRDGSRRRNTESESIESTARSGTTKGNRHG